MSAEVAIHSSFDDFADDLRQVDGEWRVSHVTLARIAKMSHPQGLSRLAERHREWLNKINRIVTVTNRPEGGGREWQEYWFDEPQSLYLFAKSDMPEANDLTVHVVRVFHRVTRGELSTAPRMEVRALEVAAQQIVAPILAEQREFHSQVLCRMDRTEDRVGSIEEKVSRIEEASSRFSDRPFSPATRRLTSTSSRANTTACARAAAPPGSSPMGSDWQTATMSTSAADRRTGQQTPG
jgi:hypothetical protein